jgi:hypothetical protein
LLVRCNAEYLWMAKLHIPKHGHSHYCECNITTIVVPPTISLLNKERQQGRIYDDVSCKPDKWCLQPTQMSLNCVRFLPYWLTPRNNIQHELGTNPALSVESQTDINQVYDSRTRHIWSPWNKHMRLVTYILFIFQPNELQTSGRRTHDIQL